MNRLYTLLLVSLTLGAAPLFSQQLIQHKFVLDWSETDPLTFAGAGQYSADPRLPLFIYRFPISGPFQIIPDLIVEASEPAQLSSLDPTPEIPRSYYTGSSIEQERGIWYGKVWVMPIISKGSAATRILQGTLTLQLNPPDITHSNRSGPEFKQTSILSNGIIHRVAVSKTGVYKIDYDFIKNEIGMDPSSIDPSRFVIYSNGDGRMPEWNNAVRIDDLEETYLSPFGMADGRIDQGDYFLWYGEGPDQWTYNPAERIYHMDKNIYDASNHYFVVINGAVHTPMSNRSNSNNGVYQSGASLNYQRLEEDKVNILGRYRTPGSGQEWYGDELAAINAINYTDKFDLNGLIPQDTFYYNVKFAARSAGITRFYIHFDEIDFSRSVGSVVLENFEYTFARDAIISGSFKPSDAINQIKVSYPEANGFNTRAWLDYIELNFWKTNQYSTGKPLIIRDTRAQYLGKPTYTIGGLPSGAVIWDITNPLQPAIQQYSAGTQAVFSSDAGNAIVPNEYIVFHPSTDVLIPEYEKEIENQNLHSIESADMVIVYYDEFESAALRLADHRRTVSQLEVVAVPVSKVFQEFAGGSSDPTAIKDFARMIYKRDPSFKYLLLIGDATYDYLNKNPETPHHNFIPAFETEESLDPIRSFPTDDYFALLDDEEGDNLIGALDIAVGRLTATTSEEANAIVNKIIHYDTSPSTLNDWRLRTVMIADDQDSNTHIDDADELATKKSISNPQLNIYKAYLDAYPQESTPGGDRYPDVNEDLDLNIEKGALTLTYMGHGGPNGWAQERILGINQAQSYDNLDNMPLFITATCSFAAYDDPNFTSTGEHLLSNPNGGAIALMTTVRPVYAGLNFRLTSGVLELLYKEDSPGDFAPIGEILRRAKNIGTDSSENNARKFTLLGDPALNLAMPRYDIAVTAIDGHPIGGQDLDTLSALEKASISGVILNDAGEIMTDFNGQVFLTVFDKIQVRKTLGNDQNSVERPFSTQNRQLFKGTATVENGEWSIEFVLPKDLDFTYGLGKMSLYAHNGKVDAAGFFTSFIIGGVSAEGLADDLPPVVQLFMNDENFVSGGITDAHPDIYVKLMDDNGINVSGTGVGHDLEAILDNDEKNSFILNDFYQAALDDYRKGEARYPLSDLEPGKHTLKVIAWDLANNSAEAYLEFLVLDTEDAVLEHVLNYPNPFTTSTYFQFEHNRPGVEMNLQILIYTINGRLVKTIEKESFIADGYRVADIHWDGLDDSGGELAKGVYVYRIKVAYNINGGKEIVHSKAEKLVILR